MSDFEPTPEIQLETPTEVSNRFISRWSEEIIMYGGGFNAALNTIIAVSTTGKEALLHGIIAAGSGLGAAGIALGRRLRQR